MPDTDFEPIQVPLPDGRDAKVARLDALAERLQAAVDAQAGGAFTGMEITHERELDDDGEYEYTIRIRRGLRIGAEVEIEWEPDEPATVDISSMTKLDHILIVTLVVVLGFGFIGLFVADVPPWSYLPGRKLGALLAFFAGLIATLFAHAAIRPLAMAGTGAENDALADEVGGLVRPEVEDFVAELPAS